MANTKNSQKVIEAEANLQAAQMLEAIDRLVKNMKKFDSSLPTGYRDSKIRDNVTLDQFIEAAKIMKEMAQAKKDVLRTCEIPKDATLVQNIIQGIRLKAQYEMEIKELQHKLKVTREVYTNTLDEFNNGKKRLSEIISKLGFVDDKEMKVLLKEFLAKHNTNIMEEAIRRSMPDYFKAELEKRKKDCEKDSSPF